jgi:hypothetical protein
MKEFKTRLILGIEVEMMALKTKLESGAVLNVRK